MFSVAWPPAAAVCLLHSMFRLRSNALRLTRLSMRPLPQAPTGGSAGIGLWQRLLMFEVWACILINCLIVAVSTDQLNYISCWTRSLLEKRPEHAAGAAGAATNEVCWHDVPMTARFLIAVAAEHLLLAIVFVIFKAVPDRPPEVCFVSYSSRFSHMSEPILAISHLLNSFFELSLKRKHAAFLFKKRYWESLEAEQSAAWNEGGNEDGNEGGNPQPAALEQDEPIDYAAEWRAEQELSDAYEDLSAQADDAPKECANDSAAANWGGLAAAKTGAMPSAISLENKLSAAAAGSGRARGRVKPCTILSSTSSSLSLSVAAGLD